jgi:hypothetical protein
VIFRKGALLKQHVAAAVKNENTERAMQNGAAMCFHFSMVPTGSSNSLTNTTSVTIQILFVFHAAVIPACIQFMTSCFLLMLHASGKKMEAPQNAVTRSHLSILAQLSLTGFSILPA